MGGCDEKIDPPRASSSSLSLIAAGSTVAQPGKPARFEILFPASLRSAPLDGRVLLILAKKGDKEPRLQIGEGLDTQQIFGVDVDALAPGQAAVIDESSQGYPRDSLRDVPDGEYYVQAVLSVYETFHRADGHVVKFHMDQGEGQHWNSSPGNLISEPKKVRIGGASDKPIKIELTKIIPPIAPPKDTKYVKHFRMESKLLSKFWGRPMYIGGVVLLPEGFDEHPAAHYPVIYYQGHFKESFATPVEFRDRPPTPELKDDDRTMAEYSYKFYQDWTAGRLPRMLIVSIQHANPYYDDSYAVNSVNVGPYGDAIVEEFMPYVEKTYRAIGQPWARVLTGGSTGGWEALAQQVFYPDVFNGSWCDCPDPVDFRAYQSIDVYKDKNAYWVDSDWKMVPRPSTRQPDDMLISTIQDDARWEATLGSHGRSTEQLDIWQAVYSPIGSDGYPKPIFRQAHRRHRPRGGAILEGALRSALHHGARLEDAGAEARGQAAHQGGDARHILSGPRRATAGDFSREHQGCGPRTVLRGRFRLRPVPAALLLGRPLGAGEDIAADYQSALHAADGSLDAEDGAEGSGC